MSSGTRHSLFALLTIAFPLSAQNIITTYAGTDWIFASDGKRAMDAPLGAVRGVAVDRRGDLIVADPMNHMIFRVDSSGILRVIAGNGISAFSGDGGSALNASLSFPERPAVDAAGNIYVAESGNQRIRKVAADGTISTLAGTGNYGFFGDNGRATEAWLADPLDVAADRAGNVYILDFGNQRIRKVAPDGTITTFAGNGRKGFSGDGGPATQAMLDDPQAVAVDAAGNVYIADYNNHRVRRVALNGIITTVAGNGQDAFSGDGGLATAAAISFPAGIAFDAAGNMYIGDAGNYRVRRVSTGGIISTIAGNGNYGFSGDGGPALNAALSFPFGLTAHPDGSVYFADLSNNRVRRIGAGGIITTDAGNGQFRFFPENSPATQAFLFRPEGLSFDNSGNLLIADTNGHRIRRVSRAGAMSTVAGSGANGSGGYNASPLDALLSFPRKALTDAAGNILILDSNNDRIHRIGADGIIRTWAGDGRRRYFGDGGQAINASFNYPKGFAIDASGNVYVADTFNHRIRKIATDGTITTVAGNGTPGFSGDGSPATNAQLQYPDAVAVDSTGNLFIADYTNSRVRRVGLNGVITTYAGSGSIDFSGDGGPATLAGLYTPTDVVLDRAGNLYIADLLDHRVRRVSSQGIISTVAGNGRAGFYGDGGLAAAANLNSPSGVAIDAAGNLYIGDKNNHRVRVVLAAAPSFSVTPVAHTLSARAGGAPSEEKTVQVSGTVPALQFQATPDPSSRWLRVTPRAGSMPVTVAISADPTGLAAGTYRAVIAFTAAGAAPAVFNVSVTFTIEAGVAPRLSVPSTALTFPFSEGGSPATGRFTVSNTGGGNLAFTATSSTNSGGAWLSVSPISGTATPTVPVELTVTVNPATLGVGTYPGRIRVASATTGESADVPVSVTVSAVQRKILLSQTGLTFIGVAGGGAPLAQSFGVLNIGRGRMDFNVRASVLGTSVNWLSVSTSSGSATAGSTDVPMVNVSANPAGLGPGDYFGQISVTAEGADNSPQTISVVLNMLEPGSTPPPDAQPTGLIFIGQPGSSPGSQTVFVTNLTAGPINYQSGQFAEDLRNWFNHAPTNGSVVPNQPVRVVVQPDFRGLTAGVRRGVITFLFLDSGKSRTVSVLSVVGAQSTLAAKDRLANGCTPTRLLPQFTSLRDGFEEAASQPVSIQVRVVDDCANPVNSGTVLARFSNNDPRVDLVPTGNGVWSGTWQPRNTAVSRVQISLTAILIQGQLRAAGQADISGTLRTGAPTPQISSGAVVHGASFAAQVPIAPGTLISVFGDRLADATAESTTVPLPRELRGTEILLGGRALPLRYVSRGQVNAQVPFDLPVNTEHQLVVRRSNVLSVPEQITVAAAQPAIFTKTQDGKGQGWIFVARPDGSQFVAEPGTPARAGDTIVIYCAGLGAVDPPVAAGEAAPFDRLSTTVNPVTVTIGGRPANVVFSGLTPGYAGLYQINAVVPTGFTASDQAPIVITVAGQSSPPVTMAVR